MTPEMRVWLEQHPEADSFEEPGNMPAWAAVIAAAREATPKELQDFFHKTIEAASLAMFAINLPPGPALEQAYEAHVKAYERVRAAYRTLRTTLLALPTTATPEE